MKTIRAVLSRFIGMRLSYSQILFVVIAFALMVFVSYTYVNNRERHHLMRRAEDALTNAHIYIEASLQEPKAPFISVSESVRFMLMSGESSDSVSSYMTDITGYMMNYEELRHYAAGVFGVFDHFGGLFLDGSGWAPSGDYDVVSRPWYTAAVSANGEIGMTAPYDSLRTGVNTITYTRLIFDDDGVPLGIVCLDVILEHIMDFAVNTRLTEGGYSLLLDGDLNVIAHPIPAYLGRNISQLNDGDIIAADMRSGAVFGTFDARSYQNERSELVWKRFDNGWVLCLMTPYETYYKSTKDLAWYLSFLGSIMAVSLSVVLLSVTNAKVRSDEESRQKSNFLATVSHEIRTPLNAIIGVTEIELLNENLPPLVREAFLRVFNSGYALLTIINDLLDLSKIEAGKMEINPARYDVASLINDVVQYNLLKVDNKPLEFILSVDENLPVALLGDEIRIRQVLNNLLSNAFKYTDSGSVCFDISYEKNDSGADCIVFIVRDTGFGMTPDQISRLFEAYTRFATQNAYGAVGGTGLGMNITKRLLDLMHGTITVESVEGEGTVFTVKIPQTAEDEAVLGAELAENLKMFLVDYDKTPSRSESFAREYMPYGSVLIVDDMESNLYVAEGLLTPYGLKLDTAVSGQEAIGKITGGAVYDVILMDHMMPVMDGIETTQKLRELGYDRPIVALTANAMQGQSEMFLSKGFEAFLSKPVDIRQLDLTLNQLIRDQHPPEVVEEARKMKQLSIQPPVSYDPELARLFVRDAMKVLDSLVIINERLKNRSEDDLKTYTSNVHSIKSALAIVGENEMSATASKLEQAGRNADWNLIGEATDAFITNLRLVIDKIDPGDEDAYAALPDEDRAFLGDKWFAVYAACIAKNKKESMDEIDLMKVNPWPPAITEAISAVTALISSADFEGAASLAERESTRAL